MHGLCAYLAEFQKCFLGECLAGKVNMLQQFCFKCRNLKNLSCLKSPMIHLTEKLQKWNIPATGNEMKGATLYEDLPFEQRGFEKTGKAENDLLIVKGKREGYKQHLVLLKRF